MLRKLLLASFILAGLSVSSADAGKVKVWNHYSQGHYDKAELKGAVVSSEGTLRLSRQLRPLAFHDRPHLIGDPRDVLNLEHVFVQPPQVRRRHDFAIDDTRRVGRLIPSSRNRWDARA